MKYRWTMKCFLVCVLGAGALGCGRMDFAEREAEQAPGMKLAYPAPGSYHALINETSIQIAPTERQGVKTFAVSPPLPRASPSIRPPARSTASPARPRTAPAT